MDKRVNKGTVIYYARALENTGIFEVSEVKIRTVVEDEDGNGWAVGVEKLDKHAVYFTSKDVERVIFFSRDEALNYVKEKETHAKKISVESEYEEY